MYKLADHGVIRIADNAVILPRQEGWDEYLQYITDGNTPSPPDPPPAPSLEYVRAEALAAVRYQTEKRILAKWPAWRQRNAALGLEPAPKVAAMMADISALRAASNTAEAAITAAATPDQIETVTPAWPVI